MQSIYLANAATWAAYAICYATGIFRPDWITSVIAAVIIVLFSIRDFMKEPQ